MMYSIKHLFHVDAPKQKVFEAISTIDGLSKWWTLETSGNADVGGIIRFRFGNMGPDMRVTAKQAHEKITWECIAASLGWVGHTFLFDLDENEGKTRVRFSHDGWKETDDFYAACCFSWGRYM